MSAGSGGNEGGRGCVCKSGPPVSGLCGWGPPLLAGPWQKLARACKLLFLPWRACSRPSCCVESLPSRTSSRKPSLTACLGQGSSLGPHSFCHSWLSSVSVWVSKPLLTVSPLMAACFSVTCVSNSDTLCQTQSRCVFTDLGRTKSLKPQGKSKAGSNAAYLPWE